MKTAINVAQPTYLTSEVNGTEARGAQFSGFTLALIANVLWGTSFLASKYTLLAWGPLTASVLRFLLAFAIMGVFLPLAGFRLKLPKTRSSIKAILLMGVFGFGALYPLQLTGLTMISSGLSAAIMLTSPLFVIALGALVLRESITSRKVAALALGMTGGCVLLFSNGFKASPNSSNLLVGAMLTLAASACLAFSVIATKKDSAQMDSANMTFWSMLVGLVTLLPFAIHETSTKGAVMPSVSSTMALLYLAVICSAVCFLIWNRAIARSSPKELATTMHVKTPTAVILGVLIAGESLSTLMIVGTLIVAGGVWLSHSEKAGKPS